MTKKDILSTLIATLLDEMPQAQAWAATFPQDEHAQRRLLRGLMNRRPPLPLDPAFLQIQDELLATEREARGVVPVDTLTPIGASPFILWQGDITRLQVDAIVNAANEALLGCFVPEHHCIDNAIHSASGLQLRAACHDLMQAQDHPEPTGHAKITPGYNLPARYVIHTVGPIVSGPLTDRHRHDLAECYRSCLQIALDNQLRHIAFCCISTGVFHFPNDIAADIAIRTVRETLNQTDQNITVVFNVFTDHDFHLYQTRLHAPA